jgi:hypothetical protein
LGRQSTARCSSVIPATTPDGVMTLGMNGKSTTPYRVVLRHAGDGVSPCAITEKNTAKKPANAITGTDVAVRMHLINSTPARIDIEP